MKLLPSQQWFWSFGLVLLLGLSCSPPTKKSEEPIENSDLSRIKLPNGFSIQIFADSVEDARSMCQGTNGTIFVGTRNLGNVYALTDETGNGRSDKKYLIAQGMHQPNGVAFKDGALFVAETNQVVKWSGIEDKLTSPGKPEMVTDSLPSEAHHGWKYLAFGPDGKMYLPVGAPCNICERKDDARFASMLRMDPDGSNQEIFAHGIRNSVGFAFHPQSGDLWFTDNGRDWLGEDSPDDELNHAPQKGMHFGYPYCHAGDIPDPEFGAGKACADYEPPKQKLGPHVAALGMKFYQGNMFPAAYKNSIFIAEHGSWNRQEPIGYRIVNVQLQGNEVLGMDVFAEGWLGEEQAWGRPVDILELADGSLLVSDDRAGRVYRITYR